MSVPATVRLPDGITTCLFDLDGVITQTAKIHAKAWKQTFDEYLKKHAEEHGEEFKPFDEHDDYDEYVDGLPRYDGVRNFLKSRDIELPEGTPDDPPDAETIDGIGNRKNELVLKLIHDQGVEAYDGSLKFLDVVRERGFKCAVVSSSANTRDVLTSVGILERFDAIVDGHTIQDEGLKGKPAPDSYLEGARRLGAEPNEAVVFEDAISGVQAGHAGHFYTVGVDRVGQADALRKNGADVVVEDLAELIEDPSAGS